MMRIRAGQAMMSKPGWVDEPWIVWVEKQSIWTKDAEFTIRASGHGVICEISAGGDNYERNARQRAAVPLLAAAPELYREYRRAIDHLRAFADLHPSERTAETEAIFYCADQLLARIAGEDS
jgi:hypothetical protein